MLIGAQIRFHRVSFVVAYSGVSPVIFESFLRRVDLDGKIKYSLDMNWAKNQSADL